MICYGEQPKRELRRLRPGATCSEVFHAMQKVIAEGDNQGGDIGRLGHGLGMQLTESPSLAAWDETQDYRKHGADA